MGQNYIGMFSWWEILAFVYYGSIVKVSTKKKKQQQKKTKKKNKTYHKKKELALKRRKIFPFRVHPYQLDAKNNFETEASVDRFIYAYLEEWIRFHESIYVNIVLLIFLFLLKNIARRGGSNEYPQSMFWAEIWNKIFIIWIFSVFLGEIFLIFE